MRSWEDNATSVVDGRPSVARSPLRGRVALSERTLRKEKRERCRMPAGARWNSLRGPGASFAQQAMSGWSVLRRQPRLERMPALVHREGRGRPTRPRRDSVERLRSGPKAQAPQLVASRLPRFSLGRCPREEPTRAQRRARPRQRPQGKGTLRLPARGSPPGMVHATYGSLSKERSKGRSFEVPAPKSEVSPSKSRQSWL